MSDPRDETPGSLQHSDYTFRLPMTLVEMTRQATMKTPVVNSFNEWDPLEEVIVGILDGATVMPWEPGLRAITPTPYVDRLRGYYQLRGGQPIPESEKVVAQKELDAFIAILEAEGVTVRRPEPIDFSVEFGTPLWKAKGGNCLANPRDVLIVFGNEILEATMSWTSRYFEFLGYRDLLKDYFRAGAKWSAAPKPALTPELFNERYAVGEDWVTTNFEPVFDAADMARCGRDIFVQRSHVTNEFGIEWLRQHLGETYCLHTVEFDDYRAIHIDATFVPLAPGKILVNPDRPCKNLPNVLINSDWELREAPRSTMPETYPFYESFRWLSMNVLSLDEHRVIVEESETPLISALKDWGFEPIPCAFRNMYKFGGSFHCATVDVRRRGALQSYF